MCFCCANNLKSLEPTTRLCPPLLRHLVVIVLFACVRYLVVLPFHAYLKRGINHFLLSLQLSMPILCVVWLVCFSYKPYFSQIKQLVCGMWESREGISVKFRCTYCSIIGEILHNETNYHCEFSFRLHENSAQNESSVPFVHF